MLGNISFCLASTHCTYQSGEDLQKLPILQVLMHTYLQDYSREKVQLHLVVLCVSLIPFTISSYAMHAWVLPYVLAHFHQLFAEVWPPVIPTSAQIFYSFPRLKAGLFKPHISSFHASHHAGLA